MLIILCIVAIIFIVVIIVNVQKDTIKKAIKDVSKVSLKKSETECRLCLYDRSEETDKYAIKLCKKVARLGSNCAMYCLGCLYEAKDIKKAISCYEKCIKDNYFPALSRLGDIYALSDKEKANYYYEWASKYGEGSQLYGLASVYEDKESPLYDINKALDIYGKAASEGYEKAIIKLILYYNNKIKNPYEYEFKSKGDENLYSFNIQVETSLKDGELKKCINTATKEDVEALFNWTTVGCNFGYRDMMFYAYVFYILDLGYHINAAQAFEFLRQSAELVCRSAWESLANEYFLGRITEKNHQKAYEWYLKCLTSDNDRILERLGDILSLNEGVEQDYEKAFTYYYRAAELNNPSSQFKLAKFYEEGKGCKENYEKAKEWYLKAAKQGIDEAKDRLYMDGHDVIV